MGDFWDKKSTPYCLRIFVAETLIVKEKIHLLIYMINFQFILKIKDVKIYATINFLLLFY